MFRLHASLLCASAGAFALVLPLRAHPEPALQTTAASIQTPPSPVPAPPSQGTAPAPAAADAGFDAAAALKKKAAYAEAATAFEAWAKANPDNPRTSEALNEAGVCWFSIGRGQMKLLRNTTESRTSFAKALGLFGQVLERPAGEQSGRAQYMRGWVKYTLEDEAGADAEFGTVLDKWKSDPKYVPKALERRAVVRRSQLQTTAAIADLQRYVKDYPKGDEIESVKRYLQYCDRFEKPAPPLVTEAWIQGDPVTLDTFRGDIVVLYFFATWCENCEAVRPAMLDLFARYEPMGVHFIGIVDHSKGQTIETVQAFLQPKGIRFPVMMDNSSKTIGVYMGTKLPDVVILDRAGRVRWHDNPNNLHDATIDLLLVEDPAAAPAKPAK